MRACPAALVLCSLSAAACGGSDSGGDPIRTVPVRTLEVGNALAADDLGRAAVTYALDSGQLPLSSGDDLAVLSIHPAADGLRHARLQQTYLGVPVFGSEIAVHADASTFLGMNGQVTINLDGFDVHPAIGDGAALAIAETDHSGGAAVYDTENARLVILPRESEGADLVWQVSFFNELQPGFDPGLWTYFIDARTSAIVHKFDALQTAVNQASGPGGNEKTARTWDAVLDVESVPVGDGIYIMQTARLTTRDMKHMTGDATGSSSVGMALDDFPDPAINDAHGFTEIVLDMMKNWMGHDSLDDAGMVLISRVHYGNNYGNAFWNGSLMTYGDGGDGQYNRTGDINTVGHETNHGFTERHSALVYDSMSGGMNESFSDVAGQIAEFYMEGGSADWKHSHDSIEADAMRWLCDPPKDGSSIDHANDFTRVTDVHYSSGIGNKAFCLSVARVRVAGGGSSETEAVRRVGQVWYAANAGYWTSSINFTQACEGTIDAARSLGLTSEEVAGISESWQDVGVECGGQPAVCDEDDRCEVSAGETCASCSADCGACSQGECGFFQRAKCAVGIGDCSRCDLPAGCGDGVCAADETDENCAQDCGCAAPGDTCGSVAPYGCWCDADCAATDDCCADVDEVCN
jgi:Zn-dependent metalloprotease